MIVARTGIIVFTTRDGNLDWRPCGAAHGAALPGGAVPMEITWISEERDAAETVVMHGFGPDDDHTRAVVALRNAAIAEMADGGSW